MTTIQAKPQSGIFTFNYWEIVTQEINQENHRYFIIIPVFKKFMYMKRWDSYKINPDPLNIIIVVFLRI